MQRESKLTEGRAGEVKLRVINAAVLG